MNYCDFYASLPGITTAKETYEAAFRWGQYGVGIIAGAQIDGATRDAGASPTTELRPGLLLGQENSAGSNPGMWRDYNATRTDGSEVAAGILMQTIIITDFQGNNVNRFYGILVGGPVQAAKLHGLDANARSQMRFNFQFDDDYTNAAGWGPFRRYQTKTAAYQVTTADNGTQFDNTGAAGSVTFTLPAIVPGLMFGFRVVAGQNLVVASNEGTNIVAFNNASASSLTFSTASQLIGGGLILYSNPAGTKWYAQNISAGANTITVA